MTNNNDKEQTMTTNIDSLAAMCAGAIHAVRTARLGEDTSMA
jgi:hypothetical protein